METFTITPVPSEMIKVGSELREELKAGRYPSFRSDVSPRVLSRAWGCPRGMDRRVRKRLTARGNRRHNKLMLLTPHSAASLWGTTQQTTAFTDGAHLRCFHLSPKRNGNFGHLYPLFLAQTNRNRRVAITRKTYHGKPVRQRSTLRP